MRLKRRRAGGDQTRRVDSDAPVEASCDAAWLQIESLDLEAQGVAHRPDGKVVFVEGALPFEEVQFERVRQKSNWEQGTLVALRHESSQRVPPGCVYFGLHEGACGGCKMQHLAPAAQVAVKQRALEDALWHLAKVKPELMLRPIEGPAWHYRYRARLSVKNVVKKNAVLIGFHERKSRYVADMRSCEVLPKAVSALLLPLRELIGSMDVRDACPQIELACGEPAVGREADAGGLGEALGVVALVLRHLEPLSAADIERLRQFAAAHDGVQWWLQSGGPATVRRLDEGGAQLLYRLPEFGLEMPFRPTDFTQVNPQINRVLVGRAVRLLGIEPHDRVIDWFCGLGNFTLPIATRAREVLGIEGSPDMIARARENFERNKAAAPAGRAQGAIEFVARDLFDMLPATLAADGAADRWLVDPPREGAFALIKALVALVQEPAFEEGASIECGDWSPPRRIVYVSCNPATLARDAELLVHQAGYRCSAAGVVNMFPHTAHIESIAVFER